MTSKADGTDGAVDGGIDLGSPNLPDEVSDEEVLLACRAYLRRHRRVEWTQHERRKRARDQSLALTEGETGAVGYFWENPEELVYLKNKPTLTRTAEGETSDLFAFAWDDEGGGSFVEEGGLDDFDDESFGSGDEDEDESEPTTERILSDGPFVSFPSGPSEEHLNRSAAQQKKWSDEQWRKMWHGRRWGVRGEKKIPPGVKRQRKLEAMVDSIPPEILDSSELSSITEEELAEAVRTYLQSGKRRGLALKRNAIEQKNDFDDWKEQMKGEDAEKPVEREVPFSDGLKEEEERLRELQQRRSEKSAKAYQTRLRNQKKKEREGEGGGGGDENKTIHLKPVIPSSLPHVFAAQEALERLEWALFSGTSIDPSDIELLLVPGRMSGRKDALLRILNERLNLRGKCIPDLGPDGKPTGKLLFSTKVSVEKLGKFVVSRIHEKPQLS